MMGFKDDVPLQLATVNLPGCFPQLSHPCLWSYKIRQATEEAQDANTEPKLDKTLVLRIPKSLTSKKKRWTLNFIEMGGWVI